jgi:Cell division protein CrgA
MSEIKETKKAEKPAKSKRPAKAREPKVVAAGGDANPVWFKPVMFGFMLLGLAWILIYYVSGAQLPLGAAVSGLNIGNANILVGFGIFLVGFIMSTRWK